MANIDSKILDEYLVQVRRIAESREKGAEKQILKLYNELVSDLNGFLGNEYVKYAEDDRLTYEILRRKGEYARFVEEVNKKVDSVIPEVKTAVDELVNDTYEKCYNGMVEGVKKSTTAEALRNEFKSVKAVRPEVIKAAVQNPIPKLRLTPTLERNRKSVIREIKREIGVGLSQGDRMSTMARRLVNRVNINYRQSMLIARTEAHRVRETGLNDAANEVDEVLKENGSEYRKIKIWNTSGDKAVRDTHAKMDGVAVLQDEKFELPSGATADCPGTSGIASEDCNCRCFLTHDIVTDAEFYALTGRHFPKIDVDNSRKSGTIENESENSTHRDKDSNYAVDWDYVHSEAYSNKFKALSDDENVVSAIETRAKWALSNRDGLQTEEIYAVSLKSGKEIARITDQQIKSGIERSESFTKALNAADKSGDKILLIHNHPAGMPPSLSDINTLYGNKNVAGITVGHDGSVYYYTRPKEIISDEDYKVEYAIYDGFTEVSKQEKALTNLAFKFGFDMKKL